MVERTIDEVLAFYCPVPFYPESHRNSQLMLARPLKTGQLTVTSKEYNINGVVDLALSVNETGGRVLWQGERAQGPKKEATLFVEYTAEPNMSRKPKGESMLHPLQEVPFTAYAYYSLRLATLAFLSCRPNPILRIQNYGKYVDKKFEPLYNTAIVTKMLNHYRASYAYVKAPVEEPKIKQKPRLSEGLFESL